MINTINIIFFITPIPGALAV